MAGAETTTYLLEKPRVCSHLPHERNYHALYMLLHLGEAERGVQLPYADWTQYTVLQQAIPYMRQRAVP